MKYHEAEMTTTHPEGCIAMTWEDAMEMERLNSKNGWAFSNPDLLRMIADHWEATVDAEDAKDPLEAYRCAEMIEWRLEDANFHEFCKLLCDRDYKKAAEWIFTEE